ncbi:MAG: GNAT family N-acetyltransferase [Spirochaetes bacterium]|nr:GNAT family N-acetyltransferase [Spirochaetota bacterium]
MKNVNIKPAEITDAALLRDIHIDALKTCSNDYPEEIITVLTDQKRLTFEGYYKYINNNEIFKCVIDNDIAGWIHFNKENMEIQGLFIKSGLQRRGFGKKLVHYILEKYKGKKIILDSTITAHKFYKKMGFKIICNRLLIRNDVKIPVFYMEMDIETNK